MDTSVDDNGQSRNILFGVRCRAHVQLLQVNEVDEVVFRSFLAERNHFQSYDTSAWISFSVCLRVGVHEQNDTLHSLSGYVLTHEKLCLDVFLVQMQLILD